MKILCDFHHGGLGRAMWYLWADRLGHDLAFPSAKMGEDLGGTQDGTWCVIFEDSIFRLAVPDWFDKARLVDTQEFHDTHWDIVVMTRPESQRVIKAGGHPVEGTKYIGVSGNENSFYEWGWVKNLIATDTETYRNSPPWLHKIHTLQEINRCCDGPFEPVTEENQHVLGGFLNNLKGYNCNISPKGTAFNVNIFEMWTEMRETLGEDFTCTMYGHGNQNIGWPCLTENVIADAYRASAATWHYKTYDGYGHSLLQGLLCGRPVMVPRRFHDQKTAGQFLVEGETCYKTEYDTQEMTDVARVLLTDGGLDGINDRAKRCYDKAHELFDFAGEAERVREWLGDLQ